MAEPTTGPASLPFPDEVHLRQLRNLLWANAGRGRATIMVGTGFSRNAVPLRDDRPAMPLWTDLAKAMTAEVWPGQESRRGIDSLILAEYYERLHGRTALDEFLRREIRDKEFLPGRLHVLLMALPWVDVLTTNYDTLLERAAQHVLDRRYAVVENQSDLSCAPQPRIIKLNGSFPSHRPFIITKEDFRTYPNKFAAFVNTVQQAIMETAVCMIGFSGEDPNFQAWTGWVRDNLGSAAPPVYHCDTLDLDVARRSYYKARNIRPIDLGPLFPEKDWKSRRRSAALEWFILSLAEGAPLDMDGWPSMGRRKPALPFTEAISQSHSRRNASGVGTGATRPPRSASAWEPSDNVPSPLGPDAPAPDAKEPESEPKKTLARIQRLRRSYPGWLLCAADLGLEHEIRGWFTALMPAAQARLDVLNALAWGLSVLNWPWPDEFVDQVESALAAQETGVLDQDAVDLERLLIREARDRDEPARVNRWMQHLSASLGGNPLAVAEWWIEKAKFHINRLEFDEAETALRSVATQPNRPFLDVERSALLFELGDYKSASSIAANAVDLIRRQSDPQAPHPRLVGQEASALDVAMCATLSLQFTECAVGGSSIGRRRDLRRSGSDPRQQLEIIGAEILKHREPQLSVTKQFDPGMWTTTVRYRYGNDDLLPFVFLRAMEVSAQLPSNHKDLVVAAAGRVAPRRPGWAFSLLVRAHAELGDAFSRERIIQLPDDTIGPLFERCEQFLRKTFAAPGKHLRTARANLQLSAAKGAMDLLSRLTIRADVAMRKRCLELAISIFEVQDIGSSVQFAAHVHALFERLFLAMSLDEQAEALLQIVKLNIKTTNEDSYAASQMPWDPGMAIARLGDRLARHQAALRHDVNRLASLIRNGDAQARTAAVARLFALNDANGLDAESKRAFVDALWACSDDGAGIPVIPGFVLHLGLLVSSGYQDAQQRFKTWALQTPLPPLFVFQKHGDVTCRQDQAHWVDRHLGALTGATRFPWVDGAHASSLIDWGADEAEHLLELVQAWFDEIGDEISKPDTSFGERATETLNKIGEFVARVIVPRLSGTEQQKRSRLDAIDIKLRSARCWPLSLCPTWLIVEANADVQSGLRKALLSSNDQSVREAIWMVCDWVDYAVAGKLPHAPEDLVDQLFLLTSLAPARALSTAFAAVWRLYSRRENALTPVRRGLLQIALERLFSPDRRVDEVQLSSTDTAMAPGDLKASASRVLTALATREPHVELWRELFSAAEGDAYPEVRRACEETREQLKSEAEKNT